MTRHPCVQVPLNFLGSEAQSPSAPLGTVSLSGVCGVLFQSAPGIPSSSSQMMEAAGLALSAWQGVLLGLGVAGWRSQAGGDFWGQQPCLDLPVFLPQLRACSETGLSRRPRNKWKENGPASHLSGQVAVWGSGRRSKARNRLWGQRQEDPPPFYWSLRLGSDGHWLEKQQQMRQNLPRGPWNAGLLGKQAFPKPHEATECSKQATVTAAPLPSWPVSPPLSSVPRRGLLSGPGPCPLHVCSQASSRCDPSRSFSLKATFYREMNKATTGKTLN
ncbi:uncharacterized protein LOC123832559 [Phyllostomus hastatus]|uniref:uncharacterized protein LOC123832559 n=1 Tax=Phyllostomus hastatus TaxID=9423 RepID=UPI001E681911|nr:uncharacterized protein LOC123832559 [Phyllostomus hastatus]